MKYIQTTPLSVRTSYRHEVSILKSHYQPGLYTYVVDLSGSRAANGIGDTDTVHADLVNCPVQRQEVDEVRTEGVLAGDYLESAWRPRVNRGDWCRRNRLAQ